MAFVRPGEQSGYVAECLEVPIVTQGATLDETVRNLKEAADLYLDGEDRASLGFAPNPTVVVTGTLRAIIRQASRYVPAEDLQPHFYH